MFNYTINYIKKESNESVLRSLFLFSNKKHKKHFFYRWCLIEAVFFFFFFFTLTKRCEKYCQLILKDTHAVGYINLPQWIYFPDNLKGKETMSSPPSEIIFSLRTWTKKNTAREDNEGVRNRLCIRIERSDVPASLELPISVGVYPFFRVLGG